MEIEKNRSVYLTVLALGLLWDLWQIYASCGNWLLVVVGIIVLIITTFGFGLAAVIEDGELQLWWWLLYVLPVALMAIGSVQGHFEFQNMLYTRAGGSSVESPFPGTRADYSNAVAGHYFSMVVPLAAWVLAYLTRLIQDFWPWSNGRNS